MEHDPKGYIFDILQACKYIQQFTAGKNFDEYISDILLKSAVERQFAIIGEALSRVKKEEPGLLDQIRESEKIIAFRNVIVHGYSIISDQIVWDIISTKLDNLIEDCKKFIGP
jgi:uncharacterized protein with HEPN domain